MHTLRRAGRNSNEAKAQIGFPSSCSLHALVFLTQIYDFARPCPRDHALVFFSDGVHTFLSNQEVVDILAHHTDPYKASAAIVETA